jgi:PAS domain S-box-containing protein
VRGESPRTESIQSINTPLRQVILQERPLYLDSTNYLNACHDPDLITEIPEIWIGVPIFKDDLMYAVLIAKAFSKESAAALKGQFDLLQTIAPIFGVHFETKMRLEALEGSELKFRRFVETSIDITFQITRSGYIDYVSSNVNDLFGCKSNDLIGKHFKVTTPMDQVSKVVEALKSIGAGETIRNLGVTQKVASGDYIPMEVSASPIYRNGEIIGAQGTMRDISERQHAQQEIERLAFFPLVNPMPVVEVDLYGVPSYINPAGIQLLDRMNLDMAQVNQILPKRFKEDIRAALSNQTPIPSREVSLDGLHLLWSGFFLTNQNLLHFYGTDITSLKNTENELIAAKESAIKNEQVKTLFLANMSHEIRTPLNSILGFTELIEAEVKGEMEQELQAYFEIIHDSGKRLWQTVHEILDISQIETGTFDLKIEELDLGKILRDLGASFRSKAEEKNLDLVVNVPTNEILIRADSYCATQAISNLIDNAIKYTNDGYVQIKTAIHPDRIDVVIKDTGIGMSPEYQERMFNAFSQESTGYTKRFQGVGLGLALAQRYLEMIDGSIELTSTQDSGSTFVVHFAIPQSTGGQISEESAVEQESVTPENKTVERNDRITLLVVEDDPNSQKLAGFTLKKDFELFFAESVAEAKQQLEVHHIDLVLLDLSLKGDEDGLDLARFVRNDAAWHAMPIIALTAHAFTSDRDRCLEAGCNDFMTKPFRRKDLLETINDILIVDDIEKNIEQ